MEEELPMTRKKFAPLAAPAAPPRPDLAAMARNYAALDRESRQVAEQRDALNRQIKEEMRARGIREFTVEDIRLILSTQSRVSLLPAKMVDRLRALGLEDLVVIRETVDEARLGQALDEGRVNAADLEGCSETKTVELLTVRRL